MKCYKCGKPQDEIVELTDYGRSRVGKKDSKTYCEGCFDEKYPQLKVDYENKEVH